MSEFVRRALVVLGLGALAFVLWRISYALLLGFGAVVFAVFLRGTGGKLAQWTGLGVRLCVGAVIVALIGIVAVSAGFIGPSVAGEFDQLGSTVLKGVERMRNYLENTAWGRPILDAASSAGDGGSLVAVAGRALVSVADGLLALVLVLAAPAKFCGPRAKRYGSGCSASSSSWSRSAC